MVASGHRETTALKLIVICVTEIQIRADVDDLWPTVQLGPFSEKQAQWFTLQLCLVAVRVIEYKRKLTAGSVLGHFGDK